VSIAPRKYCHEMVKATAQEMAGACFQELAKDNLRWARMKAMCPDLSTADTEKAFVAKLWPYLIEQARVTLAAMLSGPLADVLKDQIAEALVLDNELRFEKSQRPKHISLH